MVQEPDMSSDKFFEYDHIIEKFFKDHHDKDGLAELKNWQNHIKKCFFNYEARRLVYQKFLQRRKQILDAQFEWTPANKERFVTLNRQIYETERGLYNNLKVMKKNFKKIERSRQWRSFLPINYTISGIRYMGSYIEGEDDDFPDILRSACPEAYWNRDVRNSYFNGYGIARFTPYRTLSICSSVLKLLLKSITTTDDFTNKNLQQE